MKRKYKVQGDFDGACFLYSMVNSVIALTSRKPTVAQWSKAFQYIPFSGDFIFGNIGTQNYDDNSELYKFAVEQAISEYSPSRSYKISVFPEITTINEVNELVSKNSVVILNIDGEHWVCVVSVNIESNELLTACSDVTDRIHSYTESVCDFSRSYNRIYKLNERNIHKTSVIQVKILN